MRRDREPVTVEKIRAAHRARRREIQSRLAEFAEVGRSSSDERLWEEMVYCIFTAGASARMGLGSVEAVRHMLARGTRDELAAALRRRHRYPNSRSGYIVATREFLEGDCGMRLRERREEEDESEDETIGLQLNSLLPAHPDDGTRTPHDIITRRAGCSREELMGANAWMRTRIVLDACTAGAP